MEACGYYDHLLDFFIVCALHNPFFLVLQTTIALDAANFFALFIYN